MRNIERTVNKLGAKTESQTSISDAAEEAELPQPEAQAPESLRNVSKFAINATPLIIADKVQVE